MCTTNNRWTDGPDAERHAGGEQLARTLLERLTDAFPKVPTVLPAKGRQRVSFPSRAVRDSLPLKKGNANMTLHLG